MKKLVLAAALVALVVLSAGLPQPAIAQDRGPVTNLPMPRYVSLRASEGNARRGPDMSHRIDWVFTRRDVPLRITAEFEHWRLVEDAEGQGGWMHSALLSGARSALVQTDMAQVHARGDRAAPVQALLERNVIVQLRGCTTDWCRIEVESTRGWVEKRHIWGVDPQEEF